MLQNMEEQEVVGLLMKALELQERLEKTDLKTLLFPDASRFTSPATPGTSRSRPSDPWLEQGTFHVRTSCPWKLSAVT